MLRELEELITSSQAALALSTQDPTGSRASLFFELPFNSSPIPILIMDSEKVFGCNQAAVEVLEADCRKAVIGKHPVSLSLEKQPCGMPSSTKIAEMVELAKTKGCHRYEWTYMSLRGQEIPAESTLTWISAGGYGACMLFLRDLRELRRLERKLLDQARLSILGQMAADIGHEVNNPVAVISAKATQLLRRLHCPEDVRRGLEVIDKLAQHVGAVIQGVKSLSRDEEEKPMEYVALRQIVGDVLSLCELRFRASQVNVRVREIPDLLLPCRPAQVCQVITNLFNNAIDAVDEFSEKWICLAVDCEPDAVVFSVTDSGNGIPEHLAEKIMEPFFTTKESGRGCGIGLDVSRRILKAHGGRLWYDPAQKNTCFKFRLPIHPS